MSKLNSSDFKRYSKFVDGLARKLTKFYYSKLNRTFKVSNKLKGKGFDPVTTSDKAFEKFIRKEIGKRFPNHQVIGEEFGKKKSKSDFTWVIDPIDGTRSYVIGNPTWSNLISLNYKGDPIVGLANFPKLKKVKPSFKFFEKEYERFTNPSCKFDIKFFQDKFTVRVKLTKKRKIVTIVDPIVAR